jgi:hypothetical protein
MRPPTTHTAIEREQQKLRMDSRVLRKRKLRSELESPRARSKPQWNTLGRTHLEVFVWNIRQWHDSSFHFHLRGMRFRANRRPAGQSSRKPAKSAVAFYRASATAATNITFIPICPTTNAAWTSKPGKQKPRKRSEYVEGPSVFRFAEFSDAGERWTGAASHRGSEVQSRSPLYFRLCRIPLVWISGRRQPS